MWASITVLFVNKILLSYRNGYMVGDFLMRFELPCKQVCVCPLAGRGGAGLFLPFMRHCIIITPLHKQQHYEVNNRQHEHQRADGQHCYFVLCYFVPCAKFTSSVQIEQLILR